MIYLPLFFLSVVLFELFVLLKMGRNARAILATSQEAMRVLGSTDLADEEKELRMRRGSLEILKATLGLAVKFMLAGAIVFALFWLIVMGYPPLRQPLIESLVSPLVIGVLTVAVLIYAGLRRMILRR